MKKSKMKRDWPSQQNGVNVPVTARGRAKFTVDWYLYGKPLPVNYDMDVPGEKGVKLC